MFYFIFFLLLMGTIIHTNKNQFWGFLYLLMSSFLYFLKCFGSDLNNSVGHYYPFSLDFLSFFMVHVSFFIMVASMISGYSHVNSNLSFFMVINISIFLILILFFSVFNVLLFFLFFEMVLVPMLLLISKWGAQSERIIANYYMFMYTVVGSIPLLLFSLYCMKVYLGYYSFFFRGELGFYIPNLVGLLLIMGFLCKLPIYSLHSWLPKAHVEAPVGGSMILAGLLLKMGGYGLVRFFSLTSFSYGAVFLMLLIIVVIGMLIPVLLCSRMVDIKSFIAFSSISHMCIAVVGLMVFGMYGLVGCLVLFIGHGIISPMMFFSANMLYEKLKSRSMMGVMGSDNLSVMFMWIFLVVILVNMGMPPFFNFFGELACYAGIFSYGYSLGIMLLLTMVFTGAVMFYFVSKVMKGGFSGMILGEFNSREYMNLMFMFNLVVYYTLMLPVF
uniref:NADH-ubiquinone oxidoreductase chain 4 n=1 Tax=Styela clava TaxID=7725 RepID=A0A024HWD3_STYCL|nr:NADH dehydrogenase subunit 4 [Styela clava]CDM98932.1 NADH dehydrogenase subunit 4 [Styela clava]